MGRPELNYGETIFFLFIHEEATKGQKKDKKKARYSLFLKERQS